MSYFDNFKIKEIFPNCTASEIEHCVNVGFVENLLELLSILEQFREYINNPIIITSGYRGIEHNKKVGGSPTSQHLIGEAIDFKVKDCNINYVIAMFRMFVETNNLQNELGQVIIYDTFIHISLPSSKFLKISYYDKRTSQRNC